MLFDKSVEAFDTYLKANRGLSENTRKAYRGDVEECLLALERLRCRDLNEVTIEDLRMWMAESSKNHAKSSMARKTVAVRGFFAWTHEHGVTTTDPACALMTPKIPDTLPDVLSESQAEQLMERVDEDSETSQPKERTMKQQAIELRDAAMLELLYATGMRVAELVGLDVPDVVFSNRTVKVTGKGNKQRVMPFGAPAQKAIRRWLDDGRPCWWGSSPRLRCFLGDKANALISGWYVVWCTNARVMPAFPTLVLMLCGTVPPRICLTGERICVRCRSSWDILR